MAAKKTIKEPKVFRRFGIIPLSKVGSLNINADLVIHHLGCKPGDQVGYYVGDDGNSLVLRKLDITQPLLPKSKKDHQEYLAGEDTYTAAEWYQKLNGSSQ